MNIVSSIYFRAVFPAFLVLTGVAQGQYCTPPWCNPGVAPPDTVGQTLHLDHFSAIHGHEIGYRVFLPPDYENDLDQFYPLIVLLPGYGATEVDGISQIWLTQAMVAGTLPWSILVHLNPVANAFWHDDASNTLTTDTVDGYALIIEEMMPHLVDTFRIGLAPATRVLLGFSMGGYGAWNLALRSGEFGAVLSVDGAIRLPGNESAAFFASCFNDPVQVAEHNIFNVLGATGIPPGLQAMMILAATNGVADNQQFHQDLAALGLQGTYEYLPGLTHDMEDFVAARSTQMIEFLAQHLVEPTGGRLAITAALQGAMNASTGNMNGTLHDLGLVPATEPYTALGYVHVDGGGEFASAMAMADTGSMAIVDWVVVELRDPLDPAQVVRTRSALLRRNGLVTEASGLDPLVFDVPVGSYYVSLRHRNHLGVMTASPVTFRPNLISFVDVTTGLDLTGGPDATVDMAGPRCLWAGDVNADGRVSYLGSGNDRDPVLLSIGGSDVTAQAAGYVQADVNLDGVVRYMGAGNDRDIILTTIGGVIPTGLRSDHLP